MTASNDTDIESSFGPLQINLKSHNGKVAKYTNTTDKQMNAERLAESVENTMLIAFEIYDKN